MPKKIHPNPPLKKEGILEKVNDEIRNCKICPIGKSGKVVVGEGSPDADVVFIGEAPGKQEALSGRPFIGRSGKFLRSLIVSSGLTEDEVYITSPVKYLPDRGTPVPADIKHGKVHLDRQLEVIDPKIIVLLGNVAVQGVLGEKIPVKTRHGEILDRNGRKYMVTLHPAAGIRFPPLKEIIIGDFKKLIDLLPNK